MIIGEWAPWPDDIPMRTLLWDIRDVQTWTSYVRAFKLYCIKPCECMHLLRCGHFPSHKYGSHTIRSAIPKNPMLHANLVAVSFIEPELWAIKVYIAGIGILGVFGSRNLHLTRWPSYANLIRNVWRYTGCANVNFLPQGYHRTDIQTDSWRVMPGHVTKVAVTLLDPPYQKTHATCKLDSSICYRTRVMSDQSLHCGNRHFGHFWLLRPWPWPNDLYIWTWPVVSGDISDVQTWNFLHEGFRKLSSDRQTYIQNQPKL